MNDLDELKTLLFGAEKETLDAIVERVEKREVRSADVADILPEAIHTSHDKSGELVASLKEPVGEVLKASFQEQPEVFGDALYPVIGPAIRKSIMHTLRTFVQEINTAVDHSLSAKGVRWRIQAWRAGVPFGEYVLQKTLLYRVEQAYLISRENGLLISHVHHEASKIKDSDAVSAMFTAIQDFVKESFSPDRTGRLETADMGDFTLWAVHGPHALLVCVIRGVPPKSLRSNLSSVLERIHFRYGEAVRHYAGDTGTVSGVEEELRPCLQFQAQQENEKTGRRMSGSMLLILLIIAAVLVVFGYQRWQLDQEFRRFEQAIGNVPGVYVGSVTRDGERIHVNGLRDPLASSLDEIAEEAGIARSRIEAVFQPFQSLDSALVLRRAELALAPPDNVILSLSGNTLTATGPANLEWRQRAALLAVSLPGIDSVEIVSPSWDTAVVEFRDLANQRFYFINGADIVNPDLLGDYADRVGSLHDRLSGLGVGIEVDLLGLTDGSGDLAFNTGLAEERIDVVRQALVSAGLPEDMISVRRDVAGGSVVDAERRRVDVRIVTYPPLIP